MFSGIVTCSAEREAGPSLDETVGEVFWVGTLAGACGCDCCVGVTAGVASAVPFSGILYKKKKKQQWHLLQKYSVEEDIYVCILYGVLFSLCRQSHPIRSVDGRQSIQVCHGELQTSSSEVVIYVHHPRQRGRATKRISPWLCVEERTHDDTQTHWFCNRVHGPKQRLHVKRTRRPEEPHAWLQCYCSCKVFKSQRSLKITLLCESVAIIESKLSKL